MEQSALEEEGSNPEDEIMQEDVTEEELEMKFKQLLEQVMLQGKLSLKDMKNEIQEDE